LEGILAKVMTATGVVKAGPGVVHWVVYSPSGSADSFDLRDSATTNLTATSRLAIDTLATNVGYPQNTGKLNPPIRFTSGIFCTVTNMTSVTVGFE
jgi:hypothetical protein